MTKLLKKELKLSVSLITYLFIAFGFMALLPGYPILLGAFFICLGIFQSFQRSREANDIVYTALLPVSKADAVRSKFIAVCFIELCGFVIMAALTLVRMTVFSDSPVYRANALMTANLVYLGFALLIFGVFNSVFVGGFFKTAYNYTKPFILFIIASFLVIGFAEALHHFPDCGAFNSFGFENLGLQLGSLITGAVLYIALTLAALRLSIKRFEKIDL